MKPDSKNRKILIITYYWPPSGGSGVQRWVKFSKYLKEFGWEPIVLTVDPQKASYFQVDNSQFADVETIEVHRTNSREPLNWLSKIIGKKNVPHSGFSNVSKGKPFQKLLRILRGNLFVVDPRKGWNKFAYKRAKELILKYDISTVITTSPPHSTQLIGLKLKRKLKITWIADLRDPWTDIFYYKEFLKLPALARKEKKIENRVLNAADKILTVGPKLKDLFDTKIKDQTKVVVIPNGHDFQTTNNVDEDYILKDTIKDPFKLVYIGVISEDYNIESLLEVLKRIKANGDWMHLTFVGHQSAAFQNKFKKSNLEATVTFIPYMDKKDLETYYSQADCALLVIPDTPDNELIVTGKVFEYVARRIPVLGIGPENGDAAEVLIKTDSGKMYNYNDLAGVDKFLNGLRQNTLGFTFKGVDQFSRKTATEKLIKIISETTKK
jgi:glycosyltransferase involved in cell wall biosynthesis